MISESRREALGSVNILSTCLNCESQHLKPYIKTSPMMYRADEEFQFVACQNCGLVFLNPRVPAESLGRYYGPEYLPYRGPQAWGRFAPLVARDLKRVDRERVALVRKYGKIKPETVVLDVGCGKPSFLKALKDKTGAKAIGLDFSEEGWEGRPEDWPGLQLITGDPHEVDLSESPSVLTMWHYLEHDYDPAATLRRLADVSAEEARLFIEVPNLDCLPRKWQQEHWAGFHTPRHTALYTPDTLGDLLSKHGWEVIDIRAHGSLDPYALYWMGKMEEKGLDWTGSMEPEFWGFMQGKILTWPLFALQRWLSLGVMTAIARPK